MRVHPRSSAHFRALFACLCLLSTWCAAHAQTTLRTLQATLTASPDPSFFEANIDLFLTIDVPMGAPAPGGTVLFFVDGVPVGAPQPVQNNLAEYFVDSPTYAVGTHTVRAEYSGDANYAPVTQTIQHTVIKLRSQTSLRVLTPTIYYGQTADAIGQVVPVDNAKDASLNGGTISFFIDTTDICDLQVTGFQETCPSTAGQGVDTGAHTLTATYSGNQYFETSRSAVGNFTVLRDDTSATLATSVTPSLYGQPVTFTAKLSAPYATPVGPVVFYDGVTPIGTGILNASGVATISVSTLTAGTHSITASYAATLNFNASGAGPVTQVVVLPPPAPVGTAAFVTSSVNPSVIGQNVTFTASVATTGAFVQIPSGSVTFLDGTTVLGTAVLDATGSAQYSTSSLAVGTHNITVSYAGTSTFAAAISAVLIQQVVTSLTSAGNGFLLTVTPTTFGVGVGRYVNLSVNVLPLNGFNEPVTLSCADAPSEMRCLFDSVIIPAGGGTTRLTVNPAAPHDCGNGTPYSISAGKVAGLLPVLLGSAALLFRRRRRIARALAALSLAALLPLLGGCGHCTDLGVRPGSYTFSVQGSSTGSAAVTHSVGMKMTVHL